MSLLKYSHNLKHVIMSCNRPKVMLQCISGKTNMNLEHCCIKIINIIHIPLPHTPRHNFQNELSFLENLYIYVNYDKKNCAKYMNKLLYKLLNYEFLRNFEQ